jgi:hypothetical protein
MIDVALRDLVMVSPMIVLFAAEPFLLCRGHDPAVHNERRGAVMVISGNSENAYRHTALNEARTGSWEHATVWAGLYALLGIRTQAQSDRLSVHGRISK